LTQTDHPFAGYVRILGKGPKMFRDLDQEEARAAMGMVLRGEVKPEQLGAFLLLLRRKGETADELAGFVRAARDLFDIPADAPDVDIDWPSYADRHRQQPWFLLAALLLAENGFKVLMHGIEGFSEGYAPTPPALAEFGIRPCGSLAEAAAELRRSNFAYLPLRNFCPALDRLFDLRSLLGVRTVVNTFARDLNPLGGRVQLQGVFHPPYRAVHQGTALRLDQPRAAVFKGGGGEIQRNPQKSCIIATVQDGIEGEENWPALLPDDEAYPWREEELNPTHPAELWRGERDAPIPEAAVIATAAIALKMAGRAASPEEADALARDMWQSRRRDRFATVMLEAQSAE
jgi:anthranilate phosphoribosyltransferase